jgi:hypothetical protein
MQDIVFYSGGICSAYIACRLQDECKKPLCIFSDTKREDVDTYRFKNEVAERWGLNVVEASAGIDLFDYFKAKKMIPARQLSPCSRDFKILPSRAYLNEHFEFQEIPVRVAYGYDMGEQERADRTLKHWDYLHIQVWFPLIEWEVSKSQCFGYFAQHGIKPPRVYQHFQHANCMPCKNFRLNDWKALQFHYPEIFASAAAFEAATGLKWMQDEDMPRLIELVDLAQAPTRKGRRKLASEQPAFSFDMGCDRCAID